MKDQQHRKGMLAVRKWLDIGARQRDDMRNAVQPWHENCMMAKLKRIMEQREKVAPS